MFFHLLSLCCVLLPFQAADPVFSGPQPGEKLPPFKFTVVNDGAGDEKEIDVVSMAKDRPLVLIFVHERSRPAFGLANVVMRMVASRDRSEISGGLVYLVDDPTAAANWMNRISNYFPKGITRGIYKGGLEGPGVYGLNRKVAITAIVAKAGTVTANYALVQPSLQADAPKIFKSIADVLGEKTVPQVSQFTQNKMARRSNQRGGKETQEAKLRTLLAPLIDKSANKEEVDAAAKKIEDYAKKNPAARQSIGDRARRIINAGKLSNYGTEHCQQHLKRWAKEYTAPKSRPKGNADRNSAPPQSESGKEESCILG